MLGGMSQRAGWYDDPENPENLRYFDGVVWTSHTTPKTSPTVSQSTIGAAQPVPVRPQPTGGWGSPQNSGQQGQGSQQDDYHRQGQQGQSPYSAPPAGPSSYGGPPAGQSAPSYGTMAASYGGGFGIKTTPDGVPLASYGQRVGAFLLDYVITYVVTLIASSYWIASFIQWYIGWIEDMMRNTEGGRTPVFDQADVTSQIISRLWPVTLVGLLVALVYNVLFLSRKGATPGMMALGIQVRLRERPGNIGVLDAIKRQVIQILVGLTSLVPVVGLAMSLVGLLNLLWPLWDDKRQALHDKVARTNVVVKPRSR